MASLDRGEEKLSANGHPLRNDGRHKIVSMWVKQDSINKIVVVSTGCVLFISCVWPPRKVFETVFALREFGTSRPLAPARTLDQPLTRAV